MTRCIPTLDERDNGRLLSRWGFASQQRNMVCYLLFHLRRYAFQKIYEQKRSKLWLQPHSKTTTNLVHGDAASLHNALMRCKGEMLWSRRDRLASRVSARPQLQLRLASAEEILNVRSKWYWEKVLSSVAISNPVPSYYISDFDLEH